MGAPRPETAVPWARAIHDCMTRAKSYDTWYGTRNMYVLDAVIGIFKCLVGTFPILRLMPAAIRRSHKSEHDPEKYSKHVISYSSQNCIQYHTVDSVYGLLHISQTYI